ncbi:MAG: nucleoside deaminase [Prevotellaceae bacterium]|jgi:tRNA(adenine34) deaminase|nr:nucleoside deaminase [Prevotellaceae bacterium]
MENDIKFMQIALNEALIAFKQGEIPVGAVVVCQNQVIARAHNLTERLNDVTAHAEMQAITSAASYLGGKYLIDCTLYVTLEPCAMCAGALNWARISRVVFGAKDEKCGFTKFAPNALHKKISIEGGILECESKKLLRDFFKKKR